MQIDALLHREGLKGQGALHRVGDYGVCPFLQIAGSQRMARQAVTACLGFFLKARQSTGSMLFRVLLYSISQLMGLRLFFERCVNPY